MSVLTADHVTTRFGAVTAVDDVSLTVGAGEVVGLLGANGAGKTSLIRTVLGLVVPHVGHVGLPGGPPSLATRRRIGYVPQGLGLWTDLSVREHLTLAGAVYGRSRDVADTEVADVADREVADLPLGWRRRVAFAVALAHDPDAVILDEPTSGVDPLARARLWEVVRATADAGTAVLVSTHYLDEAALCDRVVLLSEGRVAAEGTVDALVGDRHSVLVRPQRWEKAWRALQDAGLPALPTGRGVRVPDADGAAVAAILEQAGVPAGVDVVPATLEEVFLRTVDA